MPGSGGAPASGGDASGGTGSTSGAGGTAGSGGLPAYFLGADVTITLEDEYWGATYTDSGVEAPLEEILADHGFNFIRLSTFVSPEATGGYAAGKAQPFRNLAQTITLAKRVKAAGMGFLLDLHFSDTWTDPAHQTKPLAWQGLSQGALEDAFEAYISEAVTALVNAGARPDIVQVGNEVTNGFLWDSGRIQSNDFSGFANLLDIGIAAVRAVDPTIQVMLHIEKCNNLSTSRWWLNGVLGEGIDFDILGQSCYAPAVIDGSQHHPGYQGTPAEWTTVFSTLASEYPDLDFIIAEYSAEPRAANDVMRALPNGRGRGTFNWDPTRFYDTHPNVPLFDTDSAWNDYVTIPARIGVYDQMADDYGLR